MMTGLRGRSGWLGVGGLALAAQLVGTPAILARQNPSVSLEQAKAAFLYNFALFTEWPLLPAGAPLSFCIVGNETISGSLVATVSGKTVSGRRLEVVQPKDSAVWRTCQLLFIDSADARRDAEALKLLKTLPVLTVSDGKDYAQSDGIIELYLEGGRMRFAINVDAADRAGLHLSSRLLGLARIIRDSHVH